MNPLQRTAHYIRRTATYGRVYFALIDRWLSACDEGDGPLMARLEKRESKMEEAMNRALDLARAARPKGMGWTTFYSIAEALTAHYGREFYGFRPVPNEELLRRFDLI